MAEDTFKAYSQFLFVVSREAVGDTRGRGTISVRGSRSQKQLPKTMLETAKAIIATAISISDEEASVPNKTGGLPSTTTGGAENPSHPFTSGRRNSANSPWSYRNRFEGEAIFVNDRWVAHVENKHKWALGVEEGTPRAGKPKRLIKSYRRNWAAKDSRPGTSKGGKQGYFRIPLKRAAFERMDVKLNNRQRDALGFRSANPDYVRWRNAKYYRDVTRNKGRSSIEVTRTDLYGNKITSYKYDPSKSRKENRIARIDKLGRLRVSRKKLEMPKGLTRPAISPKRGGFRVKSFVSDRYKGPALYVRRFHGYHGYGILDRAIMRVAKQLK